MRQFVACRLSRVRPILLVAAAALTLLVACAHPPIAGTSVPPADAPDSTVAATDAAERAQPVADAPAEVATPDAADASVEASPSAGACPALGPQQTARILFIGNSYTAVNDLPTVVRELAKAGGRSLQTDQVTPGGFTLGAPPSAHLTNPDTLAKLAAGPWQFVVLQEQSYLPMIPSMLQQTSLPAAKQLAALARQSSPCVQLLVYQTWARQKPEKLCAGPACTPDYPTWQAMQDDLTAAYAKLAAAAQGQVVPAGETWRWLREKQPDLSLFAADGSHPSPLGTYAVACAFWVALYGTSPEGLAAPPGIGEGAKAAQQAAWAAAGH